MGNSMVPFEREDIVANGPGHFGQSVPVRLKELERPGADPVCRDNLKEYVPIHGFIRLLEVQEYLKEDRLPHGRKLL